MLLFLTFDSFFYGDERKRKSLFPSSSTFSLLKTSSYLMYSLIYKIFNFFFVVLNQLLLDSGYYR